jgi:hypothetical protein
MEKIWYRMLNMHTSSTASSSAENPPDLTTTTNEPVVESSENIVLDDEMVAILANWSIVVAARAKAGGTKPTTKIVSYLRFRSP